MNSLSINNISIEPQWIVIAILLSYIVTLELVNCEMVRKILDNELVQLLFIVSIFQISKIDTTQGVALAVAYMYTKNLISKNNIENFSSQVVKSEIDEEEQYDEEYEDDTAENEQAAGCPFSDPGICTCLQEKCPGSSDSGLSIDPSCVIVKAGECNTSAAEVMKSLGRPLQALKERKAREAMEEKMRLLK
jgi:hypothetical protein